MLVGWLAGLALACGSQPDTGYGFSSANRRKEKQSALTFSQSLSNSGGKVTLTGDQSSKVFGDQRDRWEAR